jgi:hypothetical protein
MRTKLRSKITLLFIVCAALIAVPVAAALAQDTSTPAAPTIQSDKDDYAPGELVTLTGSGWQPGESVHINVNDDVGQTWSRNVDVTADASGNISDSFNLPDWFVATYKVTATGAQSGTVTTSFTDANPNALVVNPTSVTVTQGTPATYSVTVQMGGNASLCTTTLSASGLPSGATATFSGANPRTGNSNYTSAMSVSTTGVSPGSHAFNVNMTRGSNCQGMGNLSQPATLVVNSAVTTTTVSNITATDSTFGGTTDLSAKVSPAGAPGSVEFFVNGSSTPAAGTVNYNQSTGVATLSNYSHGLAASNTAYSVKAVFTPTSGSNYSGSDATNTSALTVNKADTTTTVNCGAGPFTYNGAAHTPCSAEVTGPGSLSQSLTVDYQDNTNAGTATASASFAGNGNYNASNDSKNFTIQKASSTTTVTCPASVPYTGSPLTPCSAKATGAGGLNQSLTVSYTNNTDAGTATATATFAGDANHNGSSDSKNFNITFNFTGFSSPVDNNNVLNSAKAGQAIPLKWRLTDASGNPVTNLLSTDVKVTVASLNCSLGTTTDQLEEYAAGSSGLQNLGNGYYQFNWKTPTNYANSCKTMTLDLGEGTLTTPHTALFKFTK